VFLVDVVHMKTFCSVLIWFDFLMTYNYVNNHLPETQVTCWH